MSINLKLTTKKYKEKQYLEYDLTVENDYKKEHFVFTNAEYFIIDINTEEFKDIMGRTGGFVANMTTRHIKERNLDANYIMLCCVPQEYNDFVFKFLYLDKDYNILDSVFDNNYYDYYYFKKKFKDCITKEGIIYELETIKNLKLLLEECHPNPSPNFSLKVKEKNITPTTKLICHNFGMFKENIKENLEKINAKSIVLTMDYTPFDFLHFKGKVIDDSNNFIPYYQVKSGIVDKQEYINHMRTKFENFGENEVEDATFEFTLLFSIAKIFENELDFYEK